jgi:hypothetical protein
LFKRDICILETNEMRRQIQQLCERLEVYENSDDNDNDTKIGYSSNNKADVNHLHHEPHHELVSDNSSSQHQRIINRRLYKKSNMRVDIPKFKEKIQPNEFID